MLFRDFEKSQEIQDSESNMTLSAYVADLERNIVWRIICSLSSFVIALIIPELRKGVRRSPVLEDPEKPGWLNRVKVLQAYSRGRALKPLKIRLWHWAQTRFSCWIQQCWTLLNGNVMAIPGTRGPRKARLTEYSKSAAGLLTRSCIKPLKIRLWPEPRRVLVAEFNNVERC